MSDDYQVISGSVHFEHKKPGPLDYEGRSPSVTLNFTIAEGSDPAAVTARVMAMAVAVVARSLGVAPVVEQEVVPPTQRGKRTAKDAAPAVEPTKEAADPLADMGGANAAPVPEPAKNGAASEDDDLLGLSPPKPEPAATISDEALQSEAQKTSAVLREKVGNINSLRVLINEHEGNGHLLQIPQERRHAFVEKCKGLRAS